MFPFCCSCRGRRRRLRVGGGKVVGFGGGGRRGVAGFRGDDEFGRGGEEDGGRGGRRRRVCAHVRVRPCLSFKHIRAKRQETADAPTTKRIKLLPTQQPTIIPSLTARTWFRRYISTNSAFVSCMRVNEQHLATLRSEKKSEGALRTRISQSSAVEGVTLTAVACGKSRRSSILTCAARTSESQLSPHGFSETKRRYARPIPRSIRR